MNEQDKSRAEENQYPKLAGNMVVLGRCPSHGYKLMCACHHKFHYVPVGENSVAVTSKGTGSTRAMCPKCNMIWNESLTFESRPSPIYYALYYRRKDEEERMVVVGMNQSRIAAVTSHIVELENKGVEISSIRFDFLSKEEYAVKAEEMKKRNKELLESGGLDSLMHELFDTLLS